MASKPSPQDILKELIEARKSANRSKASINRYEKTAAQKTSRIETLLGSSKKRVDDKVDELNKRFVTESGSLRKKAASEWAIIDAIRGDAKKSYNRFNVTYRAATHKRDGIEAKHKKVLSLAEESATKANEISKYETKARNDSGNIKDLLTSSKKNSGVIEDIYIQAQAVSEEIKNTYAITLDTGLAGTLVERREQLKGRTKLWEIVYLSSIGAIVIAILIALTVNKPNGFIEVITERLVFVTPLILVSIVLAKQFGHERKLYEEYAFKAAAAQSLRGYTVLLDDTFKDLPEARKDILEFTIGAMKNIYDREPLIQNPSTIHLIMGNKLAGFEAKIEEKAHKVAEDTARAVLKEDKVT